MTATLDRESVTETRGEMEPDLSSNEPTDSGPPGRSSKRDRPPAPSRPAEAESRARRQLARLRFDLHDGPQQDLMLIGEDMRMLYAQLDRCLVDHPERPKLLGHLEDLQARLAALDADLRRISSLMVSPFLRDEAFAEAVDGLIDDFRSRTGVMPSLALDGDFDALTDSQKITLIALIQESLHNIREHSGAGHVSIRLVAEAGGVEARIEDDGCGFDPETTLSSAAREGHMGLRGMHERVEMLGGDTHVNSRPGGPTVIAATLPALRTIDPAS